MIAVDASVAIPWFEGRDYPEVRRMDELAQADQVVFPAVVITEILSGPVAPTDLAAVLDGLTVLTVADGYWTRAGQLRAEVLRSGRRARLGDALIAQACIDAKVPLLARDRDFEAFVEIGGLKLA